jgi:hypothetical protein
VAPPKGFKGITSGGIGAQYSSNGQKKGYQEIMTSSGAGDVEALNKILNNINVQTKKNEMVDGKLPRIIILFIFSYQTVRGQRMIKYLQI